MMYTRDKRFILAVACVAAWGVSFAPRLAAQPTADIPHVSSALSAPLRTAHDALRAGRFADAISKLKKAESDPNKTPYDEHIINVLAGSAYARTNNYADAEKAFEAQSNDGFTDTSDLPRIFTAVAQINYQLKNYTRAAEFGNRALNERVEDDMLYTLVSQAYYLNGQNDAVREFLGKRIGSLAIQGRDVPPAYFQLIISSCTKLHDSACVTAYSKRLNGSRDPILIDPKLNHDAMLQAYASSP
jgi:tetratricopeptide (TPR) repeat protein